MSQRHDDRRSCARDLADRVRAGLKLVSLAVLSLLLLPVGDWRILAGALAIIVAVYGGLGCAGVARLVLLRPLLPLLVVVGGVQAASSGWNAGAVVTMRLLAMLLLADLVSMTTTTSALIDVLAPVLRVLRPLGVNPRRKWRSRWLSSCVSCRSS